ncbi:uncharacterized protein LOC112340570 [Selaginella moellendorffii]|uniref:uncharacterized protein LOC112340570 n=1 Tax=Selaginella moellendorffii TaxID=88036 RepID=UPI000D1CECF1|nr:uncharacterized protein LOC112340570 [Selaginella moellendorffii]|eukprot:XP_024515012.1 uncharacterized protein LOC112340570 [Selaginella moellendorffii]
MVDFTLTYIEKLALAPKRFFLLAMLHSDGVSTTTTTSRSWKVAKKSTKGIATLLAALKEASKARDAKRGRELHSDAIASGVAGDLFVGSSLVDMYSNCGLMGEARERTTMDWRRSPSSRRCATRAALQTPELLLLRLRHVLAFPRLRRKKKFQEVAKYARLRR